MYRGTFFAGRACTKYPCRPYRTVIIILCICLRCVPGTPATPLHENCPLLGKNSKKNVCKWDFGLLQIQRISAKTESKLHNQRMCLSTRKESTEMRSISITIPFGCMSNRLLVCWWRVGVFFGVPCDLKLTELLLLLAAA